MGSVGWSGVGDQKPLKDTGDSCKDMSSQLFYLGSHSNSVFIFQRAEPFVSSLQKCVNAPSSIFMNTHYLSYYGHPGGCAMVFSL